MASQVLSGASNPSYTNNTGENVRVVINFMRSIRTVGPSNLTVNVPAPASSATETLTINWAGVSQTYSTSDRFADIPGVGVQRQDTATPVYIGRNLAFVQSIIAPDDRGGVLTTLAALSSNNALAPSPRTASSVVPSESEVALAFPTEIILAPGQTFSAVCGIHNIVVIPENG